NRRSTDDEWSEDRGANYPGSIGSSARCMKSTASGERATRMMVAIKTGNLVLAFVLELCILAALGYWGLQTASGPIAKGALGIGAPVLAAVVWGMFLAPKAAVQLPTVAYWALKAVIFGLAVLALAVAGHPTLAWIFGAVALLNGTLLYAWRQ